MKRVTLFLMTAVMMFLGLNSMVLAQSPSLRIVPEEVKLAVGDTVQLSAIYLDAEGGQQDTTAEWSVLPDSLGTFIDFGTFVGEAEGEGWIHASFGDLKDSVEVSIEESEEEPGDPKHEGPGPLYVTPGDTIVNVGSEIQFTAWYKTAENTAVETTATWTLLGMGPYSIGEISDSGLLTVDTPGLGIIRAAVGDWHATATVVAEDSAADDTVNSIIITRDNPSPKGYNIMARISEGQAWTIGGIPHPMNLLNGGMIYFPHGSLEEDIRIHVSLPGFAYTTRDSIGFRHKGVINGVDFQVFVNDTISEPYYFETPVIVSLPFKRGLIRHMGIDPSSIGMYFATYTENDSVVFDSTGIGSTTVDSMQNRIFSTVAHFSSLVLKERSETAVSTEKTAELPEGFVLSQNYPNPFNPSTTISFQIPERSEVRLTVYNMVGQKVNTLVNSVQASGKYQVRWNGTDQSGNTVSSGVYFYRLETAQFTSIKRMILLR